MQFQCWRQIPSSGKIMVLRVTFVIWTFIYYSRYLVYLGTYLLVYLLFIIGLLCGCNSIQFRPFLLKKKTATGVETLLAHGHKSSIIQFEL